MNPAEYAQKTFGLTLQDIYRMTDAQLDELFEICVANERFRLRELQDAQEFTDFVSAEGQFF